MEAYRDQYATIFNNGRKIAVIGISDDADTLLAAWAREEQFPMVFASDISGKVGQLYRSYDPATKQSTRNVYVITPDGKIAWAKTVKPLVEKDYVDLGVAVDKVSPPPAPADST
jgi:thioredoxin-dependent peroxiredoxin